MTAKRKTLRMHTHKTRQSYSQGTLEHTWDSRMERKPGAIADVFTGRSVVLLGRGDDH